MKALLTLLAAGLLAVAYVSPVSAAGEGEHPKELKNAEGQHVMAGTISEIDHEKGTLTLDTGVAPLQLHFPPSAIQNMQMGDKVAVQLAISSTVPEEMSETHEGMGEPSGPEAYPQ